MLRSSLAAACVGGLARLAVAAALLSGCTRPPAAADPDGQGAPDDEAPAPTDDVPAAPAGPPAAAPLPEATAVLDAAVEAAGGREALEAITTFHSTASMRIEAQNLSAEIRTWWKGGDFYIENDMAGVGVTKLWKHGDVIWADDPIHGRRRLEGTEAAQTAWAGALSIAAQWRDHFTSATTVGRREAGPMHVIDVELRDADDRVLRLSFDEDSKLLVEQQFAQATPMGPVPVHVSLEDYRQVDGVQMSFRSVTSMSTVEAVQVLDVFEPNVAIDDETFTPR